MKLKKKLTWGVPPVAFAVALAMMAFSYSPAKTVEAARGGGGGGSICEGDVKVSGDRAHVHAPQGHRIAYICIKAGNESLTFFPGDSDDCYRIQWDDACQVTVSGGGTSRYCKEISHVSVTFEEGECDRCD